KETNLSVVVYSGRYYEELLDLENPVINEILKTADILIDGPFEIEKLNLELPYRGSDNQRVIDLNKTNKDGQIAFVSV
ncbi:MAG: 4Fe-4S cluster-binding domain-containing protein, partial [Acholeplasmataceae bacterium]|nr:4Fe-4S cluster-binding domain-containing protein [Acholeplasmataceae bacterium]